ncbi:MAG TPA: tyrosine-type recombinase/integrase [Bacteroidales bacterium]|nr:tyrosine-type recombinase/integrase [Bacteroidales bacterium]
MSLLGSRTTTTAMDWEDFRSLISKLERDGEYKFCLLITIGVFTGLRISDLLQLRYSQFENTDILTIQEKKTKKTRRIKINQDLRTIFERIKIKMDVTDNSQYIFINKYGTKPIDKSYVNVKLKEIIKRYGIAVEGNISSHLFRKTLGNRVLRMNNFSNEAVILLMELFSHSSPAITRKYLGIREREILDVYDSLRL